MIEASVVGGDDFVGGLQHLGGNEAGDAVAEHIGVVDGLEGGFGYFEHYGPVGTFLGRGIGGF